LINTRSQRLVTAAQNLVKFNELERVLKLFQDAEVPVIVLKGAALANTVYSSIGNRPMGDVDLFIHSKDRQRILAILETNGYQIRPWPQHNFHPYNISVTSEIDFIAEAGTVFDLHWNLISFEWVGLMTKLDQDSLWQSAQPLRVNEIQVLQLSPYDTLIHVCLHLTMQAYAHQIAYQDITTLIDHYHPFPWDKFLERVISSRLCTTCYFGLDTAATILGASVPAGVLRRINPSSWRKWLIHRVADPIKGMQGEILSDDRKYLVQLIVADRLIDVLRVLVWLFVPGPAWLAERYGLTNRFQAWLACFWHPFVILNRGLRGIFQVLTTRQIKIETDK
jgi:hypothetical protein